MRAVPGGKAPGRESGCAHGALRRKRPAAVAAQRCQRAARQAAVGLLRRAPAALRGLRTLVQVGQERRAAPRALSLQTWGAQRWTPACARAQSSAHTCWALRHSMPLNTGAALASAAAASSRYAARALVGSAAAARLVGARSGRAPMLRAPGGTAEAGRPAADTCSIQARRSSSSKAPRQCALSRHERALSRLCAALMVRALQSLSLQHRGLL